MIVVIGGGVSGLTAAFYLARGGAEVCVLEGTSRLGGNLRTEAHDGFLYDVGPDSFLRTKPAGVELCRDLGLEAELIQPLPTAARVLVAFEGALHPMPEGLSLGVPRRPLALLRTSLLSPAGKTRALLEPFVPSLDAQHEESISEFLERRVGDEVAERLVAPLLAGVFAGDAERLSIEAAFPQLLEFERRYGSLTGGTLGAGPGPVSLLRGLWAARKKPARPESPFVSLTGGLGALIGRLTERLPAGSVRLGARVASLREAADGMQVELEGGDRLLAEHVIVTGPPWAAAPLVRSLDGELSAELAGVRGTPTATVFFGLRQGEIARPLDASGFIVPKGEAKILAATWVSSKWPGRAPEGSALVRAFVGGPRGEQLFGQPDAELIRVADAELTRLMGPLGRPSFARVFRYERGSPQLELGHKGRLGRISARLAGLPRVSLIGPGYDGVGIPDCARQARALAEALLNGGPQRHPHSGVV